jgi:hypothetical protein
VPDFDDIYTSGGTYLKGEDLAGSDDISLTIDGVEIKQFDDGSKKAVLSFKETDRRLVLNKTNALMVSEISGSKNTDEWIGKAVTLFATKAEFNGRLFDAVRVRPPEKKTGKKPAFLKKETHDELNPPLNDELPPF